jgi:oligosaccharide translocation protein RFT1
VWANVLNMVFRVVWSSTFIAAWLARNGTKLEFGELISKPITLAAAVGTAAVVRQMERGFTGGIVDFLKTGAIGGVFAIIV